MPIFSFKNFCLQTTTDLFEEQAIAMALQPPSVLAQLPRPLHVSTGKVLAGEVSGLADSKKRKRYEVAFAIDGEAVNIYNVWNTTKKKKKKKREREREGIKQFQVTD